MNYYTVTVVSPSGARDSYGRQAVSAFAARMAVVQELLVTRPGWRALNAVLAYRVA